MRVNTVEELKKALRSEKTITLSVGKYTTNETLELKHVQKICGQH